jgi:hypothetical protein
VQDPDGADDRVRRQEAVVEDDTITVGTRIVSPVSSVMSAENSQIAVPPTSRIFQSRVGSSTKCSCGSATRGDAPPLDRRVLELVGHPRRIIGASSSARLMRSG